MATIGQQLTTPETGWRRYDDKDSRFLYTAGFTYVNYASDYDGGYRLSSTVGSKVSVKFYGSKIRIIAPKDPSFSNNILIKIDGIEESFTEYNASTVFQNIVYEKIGLLFGIHTVEITTTGTSYVGFDAVDIDSTGYLVYDRLNLNFPVKSFINNNQLTLSATNITDTSTGVTANYKVYIKKSDGTIAIKKDFGASYSSLPLSFDTITFDVSDFEAGTNIIYVEMLDNSEGGSQWSTTVNRTKEVKLFFQDGYKWKYISGSSLIVALSDYTTATDIEKQNAFSNYGMSGSLNGTTTVINQAENDNIKIIAYKTDFIS